MGGLGLSSNGEGCLLGENFEDVMQSFVDFYTDLVNAPLFVGLGGFALALLVVLAALSQVKPGPVRDPVGMLRTAMKSERVPYFWFAFFTALWMVIFLVLLVGLVMEIGFLFLTETPGDPSTGAGKTAFTELRFHLTKITALTAVLGAVVAFPFTLIRIQLTQEQNRHAENSLFNEKMNAAISDLHAQRQVTKTHRKDGRMNVWEDDIVRRSGALDRLEALAHERPELTQRIADMLSVYLKELTWEYPAKTPPEGATPEELSDWASKLCPARSDMEKAAQVMGRLAHIKGISADTLRRDMRGVNLQGFDLNSLNFRDTDFRNAILDGANFFSINAPRAIWSNSSFIGTRFHWAKMNNCNFRDCEFHQTSLRAADVAKSSFASAKFIAVDCFRTNFEFCDLEATRFDSSNLNDTRLQSASLFRSVLRQCELRHIEFDADTDVSFVDLDLSWLQPEGFFFGNLTDDQIRRTFGCFESDEEIPRKLPDHWAENIPDLKTARDEWTLYKSNPDTYIPPQDRDDAPSGR